MGYKQKVQFRRSQVKDKLKMAADYFSKVICYRCPCGKEISSFQELNVFCGDCTGKFEKVEIERG